jgi:hypothetical protein
VSYWCSEKVCIVDSFICFRKMVLL